MTHVNWQFGLQQYFKCEIYDHPETIGHNYLPPTSKDLDLEVANLASFPGLPHFLFFRFCVLYWTQTKEQKTEDQGYNQPGTKH